MSRLDPFGFDVERIAAAFAKKGGEKSGEIARKVFGKNVPSEQAYADYFSHCIPLCSNNPIPENYLKWAIMKPNVMLSVQEERYELNYLPELHRITDPVLYLTNTINPCHLVDVAEETAKAMTNADVTFVAFENCGIVQHDAKDAAIAEIKKFVVARTVG